MSRNFPFENRAQFVDHGVSILKFGNFWLPREHLFFLCNFCFRMSDKTNLLLNLPASQTTTQPHTNVYSFQQKKILGFDWPKYNWFKMVQFGFKAIIGFGSNEYWSISSGEFDLYSTQISPEKNYKILKWKNSQVIDHSLNDSFLNYLRFFPL